MSEAKVVKDGEAEVKNVVGSQKLLLFKEVLGSSESNRMFFLFLRETQERQVV